MRTRVKDLARFMVARHQIHLRRSAGDPYPWTTDAVLGRYKFCNVYRELDTVTRWIDENIRQPYATSQHLWFMLCVARQINWPDTLAELIATPGAWPYEPTRKRLPFTPERMTAVLEARSARGAKVYTGAYMLTASALYPGQSKPAYTAERVLGGLWAERRKWSRFFGDSELTLRRATYRLAECGGVGWGPFMAYEVITDLRHTRYLNKAEDIYTWANAGPGALRGLNRVHNRPLTATQSQHSANLEMRDLMYELNALHTSEMNLTFGPCAQMRGGQWVGVLHPRFEMRDVEHSLCEFDKYERARLGQGKPRALYRGPRTEG